MSPWLVGWRGLEIWLWSWRTDGVSVLSPVHVLLSGCREAAPACVRRGRPSVGAGAGLGALMWSHTSLCCGELRKQHLSGCWAQAGLCLGLGLGQDTTGQLLSFPGAESPCNPECLGGAVRCVT